MQSPMWENRWARKVLKQFFTLVCLECFVENLACFEFPFGPIPQARQYWNSSSGSQMRSAAKWPNPTAPNNVLHDCSSTQTFLLHKTFSQLLAQFMQILFPSPVFPKRKQGTANWSHSLHTVFKNHWEWHYKRCQSCARLLASLYWQNWQLAANSKFA